VSDFKSVGLLEIGAIGREFTQASKRLNTVLHKGLRKNKERWTKGNFSKKKYA
jgi:hypothetical protein